jgi:hypothetical protein
MTKESKILLAVTVLSTVLLMGLQLFLHRQSLGINLRAAREINKAVKATPSATPVVTEAASPSAAAKVKATATPKATVKPTETPEASVEVAPAE